MIYVLMYTPSCKGETSKSVCYCGLSFQCIPSHEGETFSVIFSLLAIFQYAPSYEGETANVHNLIP